jgi:hypothetical protein
MRHAFTAAAATAIAMAGPAIAQEENEIAMEEIPAEAMDAAQGAADGIGCTFESAAMDDDGGTETIEISGTMEDGMECEVDVLADGTVEEVEEQIGMEMVPDAVASALDSEMSGFEPAYIEKSTRDDGSAVFYEFEGMHDGTEVDVEVAEDGSGLTMVEDTAG